MDCGPLCYGCLAFVAVIIYGVIIEFVFIIFCMAAVFLMNKMSYYFVPIKECIYYSWVSVSFIASVNNLPFDLVLFGNIHN